MKKQQFLTSTQKKGYPAYHNKSISPFNNFKRTPPKNVFQKTPPKKQPLMGVTLSVKGQAKVPSLFNPKINVRTGKYFRNLTIQDQLSQRSDIDNIEENMTPRSVSTIKEDEYFSLSLAKVAQVRSRLGAKNITQELNQVLNMIKEQKLKVGEKMKILRKNNDYYRRKCEGEVISTQDTGTNPIEIIDSGLVKPLLDKQTQIEPEEEASMEPARLAHLQAKSKAAKQKENETYMKLFSMLEDMLIDHRQILPQTAISLPYSRQRQYKSLSGCQTIKIQKFFIKKLSQKLPK